MSDQEMEAEGAQAADPSVGLATAMIVMTSAMLLIAFITIEMLLKDNYAQGMFK
jgi:hypothetical protein